MAHVVFALLFGVVGVWWVCGHPTSVGGSF